MNDIKKTVGIIGGMGPMATADLIYNIVSQTKAEKDSDHIHLIVDSDGSVPDRTAAILGGLKDGDTVDYTFINSYGKYVRDRPTRREDITREYVHNDFADKLRNMMDRRGFTQKTLAEATGISQGVISGYLRRNTAYDEYAQKQPVNPTIDKVHLIAWALQCDPYELL